MNDLMLLSSPVLAGLFLGQSAFLYRCLGQERAEREPMPVALPPKLAPEPICEDGAALWAEIQKESRGDRLAAATRALEAIPDVSCDAVADAFGLPPLRVRLLSTKGRRKGKQVNEVGVYTRDQIQKAAADLAVPAYASPNDCPF